MTKSPKGKNCDPLPLKLSMKVKKIFIHILLMKNSQTLKTVISTVLC